MNPPLQEDPFAPAGAQQPAFDFHAFFQTAARYYWVVALAVLLGAAGGIAAIKVMRPIYRAQAEIKAERHAATAVVSVTGESPERQGSLDADDLKTVERTFLSSRLMTRVVEKLQLARRDSFVAPGRPAKGVSEGELTGFLGQNSKISLIPETRLFAITFDHPNAETAAEVANALAAEGVEIDREERAAAIEANIRHLEGEVRKLNDRLTQSKKELNDYTKSLGSVSIDQELNIVADKLRDLSIRSTQAKTERFKLESAYEEIEKCGGDPEKLFSLEVIRGAPGIASLAARVNDLKGNLAKLRRRYREGHPFVVQAATELKDLESSLRQQILDTAAGVEADVAAARRNEETLNREQAEQEKKVIRIKEMSVQAQALKGRIEVDRLFYEAAQKQLGEELSRIRSLPVLLQLSTPAGPGYPVTMPPKKVLLSGLMAGLALGVGIIALIAQLDSSLKSVESAERTLNLPVLAAVPEYVPQGGGESNRWPWCAARNAPSSPAAESFRTLRTALQTMMDREKEKFLLLTAARPGDGSSHTCLNLGVALAQSGLRTLLVDANLRTPALEERVFGSLGHYGLSDFLLGRAPLSTVILASGAPNLDVITAGSLSSHPVELLSRGRLRVLLDGVRPLYDRILFDSAAIAPVSDTLCFTRFFPLICLIVRNGRTPKAAALRSIDLLSRAGAKVSGLVFNFAPQKPLKEFAIPKLTLAETSGETEADFPKTCSSCGRRYETMEDYLERTYPPDGEDPAKVNDPEYQPNFQYYRRCECGAAISLPPVKRRDQSGEGLKRRQLFSELLDELQKSGLPREEARTKLLLTLKIWRNEITSAIPGETSEAGLKRKQLFDDLVTYLARAGMEENQAKNRLLETIEIWRHAP